jgi:hypothetical protein
VAYAISSFDTPSNPAAAAAGSTSNKITLNLASCTKTDTGSMEGGSTSLGVSSTIGLAAGVHGKWDSGMDGYSLLLAIPVVPTQGQTLRVVMTCSGVTGDPGASAACMGIMLSATTTPASGNGYFASGFERTSSSVTRALTPDKLGDGFVGATNLDGALTTVSEFPWRTTGSTNPLTCNATTWGATSGATYKGNQSGNGGTWTAPCVGLSMQNTNTNTTGGAVEVVWADVVITIEVIL